MSILVHYIVYGIMPRQSRKADYSLINRMGWERNTFPQEFCI